MFMQRGNYGTQQILEPIVEAMKSPSDEELDYYPSTARTRAKRFHCS